MDIKATGNDQVVPCPGGQADDRPAKRVRQLCAGKNLASLVVDADYVAIGDTTLDRVRGIDQDRFAFANLSCA